MRHQLNSRPTGATAIVQALDAIPNDTRFNATVTAILRMRPLSDWNKLKQTIHVFCRLYPNNHAVKNLARAIEATTPEKLDIVPELKFLVSEISAYECETYSRFGLDGSLDHIHPDDLHTPQKAWKRVAQAFAHFIPWSKA